LNGQVFFSIWYSYIVHICVLPSITKTQKETADSVFSQQGIRRAERPDRPGKSTPRQYVPMREKRRPDAGKIGQNRTIQGICSFPIDIRSTNSNMDNDECYKKGQVMSHISTGSHSPIRAFGLGSSMFAFGPLGVSGAGKPKPPAPKVYPPLIVDQLNPQVVCKGWADYNGRLVQIKRTGEQTNRWQNCWKI